MSKGSFTDYPPQVAERKRIINDPQEQAAKARRHCLDASFFNQQQDEWVLSTEHYGGVAHRDAHLADGWLGIRVSPDGDASAYTTGSRHFCYGMRDCSNGTRAGRIRELPLFATLQLDEVSYRHGRPMQEISDFKQELNMQTATVTTRRRLTALSGIVDITHTVYLPRHQRGAVVIEVVAERVAGESWSLRERFGTAGIPDLETAHADYLGENQDDGLVLKARFGGHDCAVVSRVLWQEGPESPPDWQLTQDGSDWHHSCTFKFPESGRLRCTKVVVCAGSELEADPRQAAQDRLQAICADLSACRAAHEGAWRSLWSAGVRVPLPGVQAVLNACQFQLWSSTRSDVPAGIPPCGLSGNDWDGGVFFDLDTWMQPPIDYFQPDLSRGLCEFRVRGLDEARKRAAERGYEGADYPWTVSPAGVGFNSDERAETAHHVTAGVARSFWQHFLITGDREWLRAKAWPVFQATADYWAGRAEPFEDTCGKGLTIAGVLGPDEYAPWAQCQALTNAAAAWNLRTAGVVAELIGASVDPRWNQIAAELVIPRDPDSGRILQWEGWHDERVIKQADTILMIHPWGLVDDPVEQRDLLEYYGSRYDQYLVMLAIAIDGVVACRIDEPARAWTIVEQLLEWFRPPFLGTSESPWNERMNLMTGLGGYLQVFMHGFAGMRIEGSTLVLRPRLPACLPSITLEKVHWQGRELSITCTGAGCQISGDTAGLAIRIE